jgi:hypothetical protein
MGTPELRQHMARYGIFSNAQKMQFAYNQAWNQSFVGAGDPKVPYMPLGMGAANRNPRAARAKAAAYVADVTARQLWLQNNAANPGVNVSTANAIPILIHAHEMHRQRMPINATHKQQPITSRWAQPVVDYVRARGFQQKPKLGDRRPV